MDEFADFSLHRQSTADQIAKGLEAMILNGELPPGERIKENPLADRLGVSRNTVREAVRILEITGLVRHKMHRGAVVLETSRAEVQELYNVRLILEPAAIAQVDLATGLDPLRNAIDELARAIAGGEVREVVARDLAFHAAVVSTLGNSRLNSFFDSVVNGLRFYVAVLSVADDELQHPDRVVGEHKAILDALEEGDRAHASELAVAHINANAERVMTILRDREAAAA